MNNFVSFIKDYKNAPEIVHKMQLYVDLIKEDNLRMNLISKTTLENIWIRHILDCAQLATYVDCKEERILDLGTGSGLPGIVLAIIFENKKFLLIEKSPKKCAFLKKIITKLNLVNVTLCNKNIDIAKEEVVKFAPQVITCRAFKPTIEILDICKLFNLQNKCKLLLLKGKNLTSEIKNIQIQYSLTSSIVDDAAFILVINL